MNRDAVIKREQRWRMIAATGALVLVFVLLLAVEHLLASCVIGFVLAYLLSPIVTVLERTRISREAGIVFLFGCLSVGIILLIRALAPIVTEQFNELVTKLPNYVKDLKDIFAHSEQKLNRFFVGHQVNLSERAGHYLDRKVGSLLESLPAIASQVLTVTLLAPFLAFFMLKDGKTVSRQILSVVPNRYFELALDLSHQINTQMGAFIRARLLESAIVGGVVWIGLTLIGYPFAVFLALFAAIANLVPYIGPLIGAVPAFVLALVNKDPNVVVLLMSAVYITAQLLDMLLIIPLVVAKIVNLHPITVVIVIIIGSQVMDILGMILSIPVTSALKLIVTTLYNRLIVFRVT